MSGEEGATEVGEASQVRVGAPTEPPAAFSHISLEKLDEDLYRAPKKDLWRPETARGVFGGQVLGQALSAAVGTVPPSKQLHSMHGYFLRKGKEDVDIIYSVQKTSDGRSFSTRSVTAKQSGKIIFVLMSSFQVPVVSRHVLQHTMPDVPRPEALPSDKEYWLALLEDPRAPDVVKPLLRNFANRKHVIESRRVIAGDPFYPRPVPEGYSPPEYPRITTEAKRVMWMRTTEPLPADRNVHHAVLAYASDFQLLGTALGPTPIHKVGMMATLDHTLWFHADFRMDEWMLYVMDSPRLNAERGLSLGKIFRMDGTLAVTVAQEGVIRMRRDAGEAAKL